MVDIIEEVTKKWEPSLAPLTKEQAITNLFFLHAYGMENDLPIDYGDFFHPDLEWELELDFPDIAGEASVLFFDPVPEKVLIGIQYATVREIINHYPELLSI